MGYTKINGVSIDNIVAKQLPEIKKNVLERDRDKHILIDGREGCGKSALAMQLAKALDENFNIDKIAFNSYQFIKMVKDPNRKKGDCILLDEAFSSASARACLSAINKAMITVATEMRQLNLFIIIVLPSFFDLDKYFAIWRCDTLFHVYFSKKGDRGFYIIFPFNDKLNLYIYGKKTYNYYARDSPYPPLRFPKQWVVDETEYRKRKAEAFRKRKVSIYDKIWKDRTMRAIEFLFNNVQLTQKEIGKILQISEENVAKHWAKWCLFGRKNENIVNITSEDEDSGDEEDKED